MASMQIDLHAHAGRFFLDGLAEGDPALVMRELGGAATDLAELAPSGMTAISLATISDLRALELDPAGGLRPGGAVADDVGYADHLRQLDAARAAADDAGLRLLAAGADLDAAMASGVPQVILSCEGADFVGTDLARVADAYERGVRSVQLVHYAASRFGDVQTLPPVHDGLTAAGADLVREMNRLGMIVDLAHASFETTCDAVRISASPIMVSHTHLSGTGHDHPRMITAEHARVVADADGVIGVWPSGFSSRSFDDFVTEIDRLADVVGPQHVGIGTDMDGNYRPVMTRYEQFATLRTALGARGYSSAEVDGIVGGNAARLIRAVCG